MSESTTTGVTSQLADGTAAGNWVLDPAQSRAEFRVKHFWGAITVRGTLERMTGKRVEAKYSLDPALLGGAVVRIGDSIYDGSLRQRLNAMRARLTAE